MSDAVSPAATEQVVRDMDGAFLQTPRRRQDVGPWRSAMGDRDDYAMTDLCPEIVELDPQPAMAVRGDVTIAEFPGFFEAAFHSVAAAVDASAVEIVGPPFGFYPTMPSETVVVEAGFPVMAPAEAAGDVHPFTLPGGRAVQAMHIGPFEPMEKTYVELEAWMAEQGLHRATEVWECYLSDPRVEPNPATWRTKIVWMIT